ncbi:unnamed protein product [Closterium sp. NIES-65]|nr:unnamed protein product [Closterium sp. NIES-65]
MALFHVLCGSFGMLVLVVITVRKPIYVTKDCQINLKNWVAPLVSSNSVAAFKDPHLVAPDDLLLRLAHLALACTAMPTASRPTMAQVVGQLQAMEQQVAGREVDRAAVRIDREIEGVAGAADFDAELARAMHVGGGGGGASSS